MSNNPIQTKKIKNSIDRKTKKELWNIFDTECNTCKNTLECIYRVSGEREICECCDSILIITDEGYMACQNPSCSIIYRDTLDQTAEWRYFGADDNQNNDPTRCGMPTNPLLQESSFGCKVMLAYPSSYEMRKIKRYTD